MKIRPVAVRALVLLLLCSTAPAQSAASSSLDADLNALFATRTFRQAAISPDGARVAWVENVINPDGEPSGRTAIQVADASGKTPARRVTASEDGSSFSEKNIAWSPDSRQLAFVSDASGKPELYVAEVARAAPPRRITDLNGAFDDVRWSPDGTRIAFLFIENAAREAGPLAPMSPATGVIEEHVYEQRIAIAGLGGGPVRQVSPDDLYVYEYDWSPDSKTMALVAARGSGDNNWWIAQLYTMPTETGQVTSILKPELQIANPRWSPDGKSIAIISGLMSDQGLNGGDVYLVAAGGGPPKNLTPDTHVTPNWLTWDLTRKQLLVAETVGGMAQLVSLDPATGKTEQLWRGAETIGAEGWMFSISLARDGRTSALVRDSFERPPEIYAGPIGAWSQITHLNDQAHPSWGRVQSLEWKSEQYSVQGWLLYPRDYDPKRSYPMVVVVHGGPSGASRNSWPRPFLGAALLSGQGYFVFEPNPRGSYGQGEAFARANVKDFGHGDLRDVEAGIDAVLKTVPVDPNRVGLTGWSYGGFMAMWAVTQTTRFRAAVAGAGVANWQSYYGQNDIDQWMIPYFGATVYDDPQVYARSAPITFIKQVKTPTLVLVGERDGECPAPQSFEFWHALKTLGVPTELVVYPNEGHNIARTQDRRDIVHRLVGWFDKYMPAGNAAAAAGGR